LDNAIKYSHKGSVVTISSQQSAGGTLLTITDQGIGIEREALTHVFDRFYRADKARSGTEGYGLGLSIAKQIADIHNGAITISSKAGSGTTVQVALPSSDGHVA
jgi:signal transduction histidine kinase